MKEAGGGEWRVGIRLSPGTYQYLFVIDGRHFRTDPNAAGSVRDGFGQNNSLLTVD